MVSSGPINRLGDQTLIFGNHPIVTSTWTVVGPEEGKGPCSTYFDELIDDSLFGETTAERAERKYMETAIKGALTAQSFNTEDIDLFVGGDLVNQITTTTFNARSLQVPYLGLYNACATFGESLIVASMAIDGGYASRVLLAVASHYQTAERQFRYPIELNIQRKATNQTTVSGSAAAIISNAGTGPRISHATVGRVVDMGEVDANDMGCAMAPAAADTLIQHFKDTGRSVSDYDLIVTGDLASYGLELLRKLVRDEAGISLGNKLQDGGCLMFGDKANTAGASGCACSATIILGRILKQMAEGHYKRVMCIPTGALHSPLTSQQGESIPCIAHAVVLEG